MVSFKLLTSVQNMQITKRPSSIGTPKDKKIVANCGTTMAVPRNRHCSFHHRLAPYPINCNTKNAQSYRF